MHQTKDITNATERQNGYQLVRTIRLDAEQIDMEIYHHGQRIACFGTPWPSSTIDAEAHGVVADDMAKRNAAEADAQASIDSLFYEGGLDYETARRMNESRELGRFLGAQTDGYLSATARTLAEATGHPWAVWVEKLTNLREDSRPAQPAPTPPAGQWVALESGTLGDYRAFCPFCNLPLNYAPNLGRANAACEHACLIDLSIMQAEFANPVPERKGQSHWAAVKIRPQQPPAPSPFEQAVKLADELGLGFERPGSLYGLSAGEYQLAIGAASAAGYDQSGHISDMDNAQFIAAVNAIAAGRNVMAAFKRMNEVSPISPPREHDAELAEAIETAEGLGLHYAAPGQGGASHGCLMALDRDQFIQAMRGLAESSPDPDAPQGSESYYDAGYAADHG